MGVGGKDVFLEYSSDISEHATGSVSNAVWLIVSEISIQPASSFECTFMKFG